MAMKFCKDCVHFWPHQWLAARQDIWPHECRRPILTERVDLVTGEPKRLGVDPRKERKPGKTWLGRERCGPEAQHFQKREVPKGPPPRPIR